jgi:hypothetical protein
MTQMRAVLANDERDELFVTLYHGADEWGEVYPDVAARAFVLTLFPGPAGTPYVFPLADVEAALGTARRRLEERGYPHRPVGPPPA